MLVNCMANQPLLRVSVHDVEDDRPTWQLQLGIRVNRGLDDDLQFQDGLILAYVQYRLLLSLLGELESGAQLG